LRPESFGGGQQVWELIVPFRFTPSLMHFHRIDPGKIWFAMDCWNSVETACQQPRDAVSTCLHRVSSVRNKQADVRTNSLHADCLRTASCPGALMTRSSPARERVMSGAGPSSDAAVSGLGPEATPKNVRRHGDDRASQARQGHGNDSNSRFRIGTQASALVITHKIADEPLSLDIC
jgi:hypothetical protein